MSNIDNQKIIAKQYVPTSRNDGIINRMMKIQTDTITHFELTLVQNLFKICGADIDNALLKAISERAIQSTYANMNAKDMEATHHASPNCQG